VSVPITRASFRRNLRQRATAHVFGGKIHMGAIDKMATASRIRRMGIRIRDLRDMAAPWRWGRAVALLINWRHNKIPAPVSRP